ncbi:hypothetical protein BKK79_29085 [Cupriavidus sp. USMAA2-4]|uniref:hypothetical protein n=1 Tax=Cupriavidus sp. USMAA2-4 TaxID=876364 RepID=UPI0008A6BFEA|nr:hypothetical protein [Cupriavidus sp. USMAA2-4]AOY95755.1 hypothetical protein BKK79_29085 [Cupriavidus sp. USMAA2-4]
MPLVEAHLGSENRLELVSRPCHAVTPVAVKDPDPTAISWRRTPTEVLMENLNDRQDVTAIAFLGYN